MAVKQLVLFACGATGLLGLIVAPASHANAQEKIDLGKLQTSAPANGVVMSQDAENVYVYDSGKEKMIVVSKTARTDVGGELVPQTWVINTKTMKASGLR